MLPTAGSQADGKSGSFQNMLSKYGLASSVTGSADGVNYNIAAAPLYFVRSGGFYLDAGTAGGPHSGNMGNNGQFWSSRSDSTTTNAYNLYFDASNVNPSNSNDRWRGYPLRCLFVAAGADL